MEPLLRLPQGVTDENARYRPCLEIRDRVRGEHFLDELAQDYCEREGHRISWKEAREREKENLGFWAGLNLDWWEQLQIFFVFNTMSPIFGRDHPSTEEAFFAALRVALEMKGKPMSAAVLFQMHRHTDHLYRWRKR